MDRTRLRFYFVALVFFLAACARLVYWTAARPTPLERWSRWDQSDMHTFAEQSRRLAAGDWLGRDPYHPYHAWQRLAPAEKWEAWYGKRVFHQAPGYSYLLAIARSLTPKFEEAAKFIQLMMGALGAVIVFLLAERIAGLWAGLVAGLIIAFYGPLIQTEHQLLREGIAIPLTLFGALWLTRCLQREETASFPRPADDSAADAKDSAVDQPADSKKSKRLYLNWFGVGLLFGAVTFLHESGRVAIIAAALATGVASIGRPKKRLAAVAGLLFAGYAAALAPWTIRNLVVGAPALSLSSRSAVVFAMSNHAEAPHGGSRWGAPDPKLAEVLDRAAKHPWGALGAAIGSYEGDFALLAKNLMIKAEALCRVREAPDNTSYAFYRSRLWPLKPSLAFWAVFAPGLAGAALVMMRSFGGGDRSGRTLLVFLVCTGAALCLVHSLGRLRLLVVPYLAVFSGVLLAELCSAAVRALSGGIRASPMSRAVWAGALTVLFAAGAVQWRAESGSGLPRFRAVDFIVAADLERESGGVDQAIEDYRMALELGDRHPIRYHVLGALLWEQGRGPEAISVYEEGLRINAGGAGALAALRHALARAYAESGRSREAEAEANRALRAAEALGNAELTRSIRQLLSDLSDR